MNCTCQPGTEQNGWHEKRCDWCRTLELAEWSGILRMDGRLFRQRPDEYWALRFNGYDPATPISDVNASDGGLL